MDSGRSSNASVTSSARASAASRSDASARELEAASVQAVYEAISGHFSDTRYKPWPLIVEFLSSLSPGACGLESGSGNGKNLGLGSILTPANDPIRERGDRVILGLDRSRSLSTIAHQRGHEVVEGDAMDLPWREGVFDFALSIATIHHLATPERRREAVKALIRAVDPTCGRLLIQVWAVEQRDERALLKGKGRQTVPLANCDDPQDVLVPWKLPQPGDAAPIVYERYYRLFAEGELDELVRSAALELGLIVDAADPRAGPALIVERTLFERGNWAIEARRCMRGPG